MLFYRSSCYTRHHGISGGGGDTSIATDIETVPVVAVSRTHPGSSCVVLVAPPVTQDIMASVGGGIQVSLQILRLFLS